MAHSDESPEAVDLPAFDGVDDAAAALNNALGGGEPNEAQEQQNEEGQGDESELAETDFEDEGEGESEPETVIAAPVSLTADEKANFAQLQPEAQRMIADIEARRNGDVQKVTTRAAEAQRAADQAAANADAHFKAVYAEQMRQVVSVYAPQPPDPDMAQYDPQGYIAADAKYRAATAQHDQIMQRVAQMEAQSLAHNQQAEAQAMQAEWRDVAADLPEAQDPSQWQALLQRLTPLAVELGYPMELIEQAGPKDIRAIKRYAAIKEKADKYDAAMAKRMQRVRSAKTVKPGQGMAAGQGNRTAIHQAVQSGSVDDAAAALSKIL